MIPKTRSAWPSMTVTAPTDAYRWLRRRGYEPEQIVLAGDSAGGYLAQRLQEKDEEPAALVEISPPLQLAKHELSGPFPGADTQSRHPAATAVDCRGFPNGNKGEPQNCVLSPVARPHRRGQLMKRTSQGWRRPPTTGCSNLHAQRCGPVHRCQPTDPGYVIRGVRSDRNQRNCGGKGLPWVSPSR